MVARWNSNTAWECYDLERGRGLQRVDAASAHAAAGGVGCGVQRPRRVGHAESSRARACVV